MNYKSMLAGVLSVVFTSIATAAEIESPMDALSTEEQAECAAFGEVYLRLAELRDAGSNKAVATDRVTDYLATVGRTGSHVKGNYPQIRQFADFVYANPKLNRRTVYLYGLSSCAISRKAPDDAEFDKAMTGLEKVIGRCQVKFPQDEQVEDLGRCILTPANKQLQIWAKPN